jgi:hypothetical protein
VFSFYWVLALPKLDPTGQEGVVLLDGFLNKTMIVGTSEFQHRKPAKLKLNPVKPKVHRFPTRPAILRSLWRKFKPKRRLNLGLDVKSLAVSILSCIIRLVKTIKALLGLFPVKWEGVGLPIVAVTKSVAV